MSTPDDPELSAVLDQRHHLAAETWERIREVPQGPERDHLVGAMSDSEGVISAATGRGPAALLAAAEKALKIVEAVNAEARAFIALDQQRQAGHPVSRSSRGDNE